MRQQLVQPSSDLHQILRRLFLDDLVGDLAAIRFPVRFGDIDIRRQIRAVHKDATRRFTENQGV